MRGSSSTLAANGPSQPAVTGCVRGRCDVPRQRREASPAVLGVISVGGGLGALARYGLEVGLPPGSVPWGTLVVNVVGCALIGVLMVLVAEVWSAHRLLRPFLGVGVLGGFTTFSTYAVDAVALLPARAVATAALYLAATVLSCLLATLAAVAMTRLVTRPARRLR